jgi:hypothetical protein
LYFVLIIQSDARLEEIILTCGGGKSVARSRVGLAHPLPIFGLVKAVINRIIANLQTENIFDVPMLPLIEQCVARVEARDPALIRLLKLVAAIGIRKKISEIREQIEVVIKTIGH